MAHSPQRRYRALAAAIGALAVAGMASPAQAGLVVGSKAVTGDFVVGGTVTYKIVLSPFDPTQPQANNPGDEFVDFLPAGVSLVTASASSGTVGSPGPNVVVWNGSLPPAVEITIVATINPGTEGQTIENRGIINYDNDMNGTNESSRPTEPASFTVVVAAPTTVAAAPAFRLNPTYRATLTVTAGGAPLADRTVVFRVSGVQVCSAVSNTSGVATCRRLGIVLGPGTYTASFAGDDTYLPSAATGRFTP